MKFGIRMALASLLTAVLAMPAIAGTGTLKGQVVFDGDVVVLKPKVTKGDATVKDAQCCAAQTVPNDELRINADNKGLADVFVYISKVSKSDIPEHLQKSAEPLVEFDQKGCQFQPHTLIVRTDQQVLVKSGDNVPHNTHTFSIFNPGVNFIVSANDRTGIKVPKYPLKERLPFEVKCDIHPWMRAWWLVVDHPYAVTTDADGNFELKDVPEGEHTLVIWHSRAGYIEKTLAVKVAAGETTDLKAIKADAKKFELE